MRVLRMRTANTRGVATNRAKDAVHPIMMAPVSTACKDKILIAERGVIKFAAMIFLIFVAMGPLLPRAIARTAPGSQNAVMASAHAYNGCQEQILTRLVGTTRRVQIPRFVCLAHFPLMEKRVLRDIPLGMIYT